MKKMLALLVAVALCSCGGTDPQIDSVDQSIIGGVEIPAEMYPAVVSTYAIEPGAEGGALCTGTVISPTVVLTAAHCVSRDLVGQNAEFYVFRCANLNEGPCDPIAVADTIAHQGFNPRNPAAGFDVGLVFLAEPIDVEPMPINTQALAQNLVGKPVELVGYGLDKHFRNRATAGIKRHATEQLRSFNNMFVRHGQFFGKGICSGDSGGPVIMKINGVEKVIGVNSYGQILCFGQSSSTRVDSYLDWILPKL